MHTVLLYHLIDVDCGNQINKTVKKEAKKSHSSIYDIRVVLGILLIGWILRSGPG